MPDLMIRILEVSNQKDLDKIMREIQVDPYGIRIMAPKGIMYLARVSPVTAIAANILKQEMLSLGGDVAIARGALTGRVKKTDCLLMGNLSQLGRLCLKLNRQPFGLALLGQELSATLENYQKDNFVLDAGRYTLRLKRRAHLMGIVNMTPDSFSGDGLYQSAARGARPAVEGVIAHVEQMVRDGADIIDIGGESSRPGARPVKAREEINRTAPLIRELAKRIKVPISIDTCKPQVAEAALDSGASMVNDITGLRNGRMLKAAARHRAAVVIMHMKGSPRTMQKNPVYGSLMNEILGFLAQGVLRASQAGIKRNSIIVDPGIGFGKTKEHNLKILKHLQELRSLGQPLLVGLSRKSFIGKVLNVEAQGRLAGTISACVLSVKNGAHIVRVHDVLAVKQALQVLDAVAGS